MCEPRVPNADKETTKIASKDCPAVINYTDCCSGEAQLLRLVSNEI